MPDLVDYPVQPAIQVIRTMAGGALPNGAPMIGSEALISEKAARLRGMVANHLSALFAAIMPNNGHYHIGHGIHDANLRRTAFQIDILSNEVAADLDVKNIVEVQTVLNTCNQIRPVLAIAEKADDDSDEPDQPEIQHTTFTHHNLPLRHPHPLHTEECMPGGA